MTEKKLESIRIIGLPKGSVLWPTAAFAFFSGLISLVVPDLLNLFSGLFLMIFMFNLLILFFDFSRGSIFGIAGLIVGIIALIVNLSINILDPLKQFLQSGLFGVTAEFLFMFGAMFLILFFLAIMTRRSFEYFVISSNEIVKKEGFLGDASRFNATDIQIDKTITDVFESLLLFGAGDLTLRTQRGQEFHILNVPRINKVEREIREILGKIEVDTT